VCCGTGGQYPFDTILEFMINISQTDKNKSLQKVYMKIAGKDANSAPYTNTRVVGRKTGEYAAYLEESNTPFVIMFWAM
jgi:hypothetical protein